MKSVTSRSNPVFKSLVKLKNSARERRRERRTLLDGLRLVNAYLESVGPPDVVAMSVEACEKPEAQRLLARGLEPTVLSNALFRELSAVTTPSGMLAVVPVPPPQRVPTDVPCCLLLENIQDPGNLGSVLRSAAASGVLHVAMSKGCVDAWSPRVLRGAMGAHFVLVIEENADLARFAADYQGQVVAAAAHAEHCIFEIDLSRPTAFVLGNEGAGISPAVMAHSDIAAAVPMAGAMESLNVGAAAAVCLFERVRQLRQVKVHGKR